MEVSQKFLAEFMANKRAKCSTMLARDKEPRLLFSPASLYQGKDLRLRNYSPKISKVCPLM